MKVELSDDEIADMINDHRLAEVYLKHGVDQVALRSALVKLEFHVKLILDRAAQRE